jgi:hypothetical protein
MNMVDMDSSTITAWGTTFLAVIAVVAAIISVMAMRRQSKQTKIAIEVDVLLRLDEEWRCSRMIGVRTAAASALMWGHTNSSVDEVLDFLESIALLLKRDVLDEEITWPTFYWPMANYWLMAQQYIEQVRKDEGVATWGDLGDAVARLRKVEALKSGLHGGQIRPRGEQPVHFLSDESKLTQSVVVQE